MSRQHLFTTIFHRYQNDLLRFVVSKFGNHHDAEDIVQDAFHNILKSASAETIENPRAYLYQAASNLALNRIQKEQRHQDYGSQESDDVVCSPEISVLAGKELEKIEDALAMLPEKYRRTFILSRVQGKTYLQISDELGISVSTVEKHVIKVLSHLRDQVGELR